MGGLVFENCSSLSEIYLPKCTFIKGAAFNLCTSLTTASLGALLSVSKWYGNPVFLNNGSLSQLYIGTGVAGIVQYDNLFSANFPTSLQSGIGSIYTHWQNYDSYINATGWSSLSSLFVSVGEPDKPLLSFSDGLLYGENVIVNKSYYAALGINSNSITAISFSKITTVYTNDYTDCSHLTSVSLPACKRINDNGFYGCLALTYIDLPECEFIGKTAFYAYPAPSLTIVLRYNGIVSRNADQLVDGNGASKLSILVPSSLVDAYKSAQYWSVYSSRIFPIE